MISDTSYGGTVRLSSIQSYAQKINSKQLGVYPKNYLGSYINYIKLNIRGGAKARFIFSTIDQFLQPLWKYNCFSTKFTNYGRLTWVKSTQIHGSAEMLICKVKAWKIYSGLFVVADWGREQQLPGGNGKPGKGERSTLRLFMLCTVPQGGHLARKLIFYSKYHKPYIKPYICKKVAAFCDFRRMKVA